MRTITVLAFVCLLAGTAAAQSGALDRGPGVLGPESPLYGLEKAWDSAAVNMGLKNAGDVAQERAAEAQSMLEKGNPGAASRAAKDLQKIAGKATEKDQKGIQKAMTAMQDTMSQMQQQLQNAPNDNARQGITTAMQNMQDALSNLEQVQQKIAKAMQQANTGTDQGTTTGGSQSQRAADSQAQSSES